MQQGFNMAPAVQKVSNKQVTNQPNNNYLVKEKKEEQKKETKIIRQIDVSPMGQNLD